MRHSDNGDGTFTNPLIFADYPDPDIIRVGDDFYLASSSFTDAPGVPICHSRDLVNWRIIGHAYERLPAANPGYSMTDGRVMYRGGSWAPSIRHHRGVFYICFNTPAEGFFMCSSPAPEGPYEMTWFGGRELYDPSLFFDDDGRVYVAHTCGDIYLTELTPDARAIAGPDRYLFSSAYGTPMEGAHLYKHRGYYYICTPSHGYNGIQIVHRASALLGPYDSRVICAEDMNYHGAGLHQGGFVDLPNGDTWFFMFQDRDYVGRVPILLPITWEDGWPRLGNPHNSWRIAPTQPKPALPPRPLSCTEASDHFDGPSLGLYWRWNHNPDDTRWSLVARPGWLRLTASHAPGLMNARNTLTQKITGHGCSATIRMDIANLRAGDIAGLCVLGFPSAYIAVEVTSAGPHLIMVNNDARIAAGEQFKGPILYLRAEADREGLARFSYSADDLTYTPLGNELVMQFSVKSFLGNKFGILCFSQIPGADPGYVDVDLFRYECARSLGNRLIATAENTFADYDDERGTHTQRRAEKQPHQCLVNIHDGDWVRYDQIDFVGGADTFQCLAAPVGEGGRMDLRLGGPEGRIIGSCELPGNGEKNQWLCPWLPFVCAVEPLAGMHPICITFAGGAGHMARLDTFTFRLAGA